jgi:hypothetical protein
MRWMWKKGRNKLRVLWAQLADLRFAKKFDIFDSWLRIQHTTLEKMEWQRNEINRFLMAGEQWRT